MQMAAMMLPKLDLKWRLATFRSAPCLFATWFLSFLIWVGHFKDTMMPKSARKTMGISLASASIQQIQIYCTFYLKEIPRINDEWQKWDFVPSFSGSRWFNVPNVQDPQSEVGAHSPKCSSFCKGQCLTAERAAGTMTGCKNNGSQQANSTKIGPQYFWMFLGLLLLICFDIRQNTNQFYPRGQKVPISDFWAFFLAHHIDEAANTERAASC